MTRRGGVKKIGVGVGKARRAAVFKKAWRQAWGPRVRVPTAKNIPTKK